MQTSLPPPPLPQPPIVSALAPLSTSLPCPEPGPQCCLPFDPLPVTFLTLINSPQPTLSEPHWVLPLTNCQLPSATQPHWFLDSWQTALPTKTSEANNITCIPNSLFYLHSRKMLYCRFRKQRSHMLCLHSSDSWTTPQPKEVCLYTNTDWLSSSVNQKVARGRFQDFHQHLLSLLHRSSPLAGFRGRRFI